MASWASSSWPHTTVDSAGNKSVLLPCQWSRATTTSNCVRFVVGSGSRKRASHARSPIWIARWMETRKGLQHFCCNPLKRFRCGGPQPTVFGVHPGSRLIDQVGRADGRNRAVSKLTRRRTHAVFRLTAQLAGWQNWPFISPGFRDCSARPSSSRACCRRGRAVLPIPNLRVILRGKSDRTAPSRVQRDLPAQSVGQRRVGVGRRIESRADGRDPRRAARATGPVRTCARSSTHRAAITTG